MRRSIIQLVSAMTLASIPSLGLAQAQWLTTDQNLTNHSASQLNRATDAGRSIVIDSQNNVYVAWMDNKGGDWDIYFRWYDEDGWHQEQVVSENVTDSRNPTLMVRPQIGADPEQVWVAWVDNSSGQYEAYYRRWNVVTKSWIDVGQNAQRQLSDAGGAPIVYNGTTNSGVSLCTTNDGSKVYAFYPNDLSPYNKAYTKTFQNNTWTTEAQVPTGQTLDEHFPFAVIDNSGVTHLVFNAGDQVFYTQRQSNGSWTGSSVLVGNIDANFGATEGVPWIAVESNGKRHVVWFCHIQDVHREVYYRRFNGQSWDNAIILSENTLGSDKKFPSVAVDGNGNVWVFWHKELSNFDIYYRKYSGSWGPRQTLTSISGLSAYPVVALDLEKNVYVSWTDARTGNNDVFYNLNDLAAPAKPLGMYMSNNGQNPVVNWSFNAEKDIYQYQIHRGLSGVNGQPPTSYNLIGTAKRNQNQYTDYSLLIGGGWKRAVYKIKALDNAQRLSAFSDTVGIDVSGFAKRNLPEEINEMPTQYALHQNYPNPFNPSTTLRFDLPDAGHVSLKIYDLLGTEVLSLVDEDKSAGTHQVELDGAHLQSGVYLCRLQAGGFSQTIKVTLLK